MIEQDKAKAVQVELLKKENGKLISQLTAQESVIDGLKMERKIWGQELAQQGKTLFYYYYCFYCNKNAGVQYHTFQVNILIYL